MKSHAPCEALFIKRLVAVFSEVLIQHPSRPSPLGSARAGAASRVQEMERTKRAPVGAIQEADERLREQAREDPPADLSEDLERTERELARVRRELAASPTATDTVMAEVAT